MNLFNIKNAFAMKKANQWPEIYWCIDLHGTIIPSGKTSKDGSDELVFYPYAYEVLEQLSNRKDIILILWTSTPIKRIVPIWEWLTRNGIYFRYLNGNPHAKDTPRSDFSKKFYFNVLLDDRGGFEPATDWKLIKDELISIGEWK